MISPTVPFQSWLAKACKNVRIRRVWLPFLWTAINKPYLVQIKEKKCTLRITEANKMHYFSNLFWYTNLHVSDTLSIISLDTVFTAIGICHTIYSFSSSLISSAVTQNGRFPLQPPFQNWSWMRKRVCVTWTRWSITNALVKFFASDAPLFIKSRARSRQMALPNGLYAVELFAQWRSTTGCH
jgi:hypothetical protein